MQSKFAGHCPWCGGAIAVGQDITRHQRRYGHTACVAAIGEVKRRPAQADGQPPAPAANEAKPARDLTAFWQVSEPDAP